MDGEDQYVEEVIEVRRSFCPLRFRIGIVFEHAVIIRDLIYCRALTPSIFSVSF